MADDTFEQRLQAFYDEGTEEDRELIRFMCAATLALAQQRDAAEVEGFQFTVAPGAEVPSFGAVDFTAPVTDSERRTLGNLLKKWSDTSQTITQNMK